MAKFTVHTAVHGERGTEFFKPGDDVPEWAVGKFGDHVTDAKAPDSKATDSEPESDDEGDDAKPATKAPDFTAPRQTRQRRK